MTGLSPLQLLCGPAQYHESLGEQPGTFQIEEIVEAGQDLVPVPVQRFQIVRDLALYVRDAPLCLHVLLAIAVALLGAPPVLFQPFQLGGDQGKPGGLGLQATQFLLRGGEVGETFLRLQPAVFGAAPVRFGLTEVGRKARVFAVRTLQGGTDLAGRSQAFFGGGVLFGDLLQLGLETIALLAGVLQLALEGVEVGLGEAAFEEPRLGAEGIAVLAQEGLGGLHAADTKDLADLTHPAYALVVGEETKLLLTGVERRLEGRPVHPEQVLLDPARHVGRPADERIARGVESLGARRTAPQTSAHGKRATVGRQGHLDDRRVLRRAATPGDRLVGEARSAAARTKEGPQDALEQGRLASAVRPDYADGSLGRIELYGLPELLVVLDEEALQDHAALSGSSLAARVRYARPFSRNSSANFASSSPRSLRSATNAANSSPSGPKTAVEVPFLSTSSGRSSAWTSSEKFRQRRCKSLSSSRSMPLATPCRTSYALRRTMAPSRSTPEVLSCTVSVSPAASMSRALILGRSSIGRAAISTCSTLFNPPPSNSTMAKPGLDPTSPNPNRSVAPA